MSLWYFCNKNIEGFLCERLSHRTKQNAHSKELLKNISLSLSFINKDKK